MVDDRLPVSWRKQKEVLGCSGKAQMTSIDSGGEEEEEDEEEEEECQRHLFTTEEVAGSHNIVSIYIIQSLNPSSVFQR